MFILQLPCGQFISKLHTINISFILQIKLNTLLYSYKVLSWTSEFPSVTCQSLVSVISDLISIIRVPTWMNIVRPGVSEGNQDMAGINYISPSNNNLNILKRKILKYLTWNLFFNLYLCLVFCFYPSTSKHN